MPYSLGATSRARLEGVHPDLIRVVERAVRVTPVDLTVLEGVRSVARQRELVRKGASKTMDSRHITGHAVDLGAWIGGQVRWDWPLYGRIAEAFKAAARDLRIPLTWGGDWTRLRDGPHFELDRRAYP